MSARDTSIEAYKNLITNGVLNKMNSLVYKHLYKHGPTTQKKTERFYDDRTYTLRPRFAQLEKMGLIKCVGEEKCKETKKMNMLWDVTNLVSPKDINLVKKPKEYKIEKAINALRQLYKKRKKASDHDWKTVADLIKNI